jgi:hypothetical protein
MHNLASLTFSFIVYIFAQDIVLQEYYSPQGETRQGEGPQALVPASKRFHRTGQDCACEDTQSSCTASQSRFTFYFPHHPSHGYEFFWRQQPGLLPLEVCMWTHKQKVAYRMCSLLCPVDSGYKASHTTEKQETSELWMEHLWMGRLGKMGRGQISFFQPRLQQAPFWCDRSGLCNISVFFSDANEGQRQLEGEEREARKKPEQAERTNVALSGRAEELCPMGNFGHICFYSINYPLAQPVCGCQLFFGCTRSRVGRSTKESIFQIRR